MAYTAGGMIDSASSGVPEAAGSAAYRHAQYVTPDGAEWLASASSFPRSVRALWSARPTAPTVLPCGTAFDVVNLPALFGRRVLEQLWSAGPGSGPTAECRGRILLLVAPGAAQRLPSLLSWEEWGRPVPSLLCHGEGDSVALPRPTPTAPPPGPAGSSPPTPTAPGSPRPPTCCGPASGRPADRGPGA